MIACARLCGHGSQELLELERYANARKSLSTLLLRKHTLNLIELNREAMDPRYRNNHVYILLLRMMVNYCLEKNYTLITTTNMSEWVSIYNEIKLPKQNGFEFKYFNTDTDSVNVYFASCYDLHAILNKLNSYLQRSDKRERSTDAPSGKAFSLFVG